jgi:hypothetical protein
MTIQYINTGSSANAGNGDSLRSAFIKVNNNFSYLSTASFGGAGTGYTGSRGSTGTNGFTGSAGTNGYTGSQGPTGSINDLSDVIIQNSTSSDYLKYVGGTWTNSQLSIINDLSPRLGNSLDTNGYLIESSGGNFVVLKSTGTGILLQGPVTIGSVAQSIDGSLYIVRNTYSTTLGQSFTYAQHHNNADAINFNLYRTRGTSTAIQAVQNGDDIADIAFIGHDGINQIGAGTITVSVDGAVSTGVIPVKMSIVLRGTDGFLHTRAEISNSGTWRVDNLRHLSTTTSSITVSTNLIPSADLTYDLGSTSSQWRSLYVGTSTIYLGGVAVSIAGGNLTINGNPVSASTSLVNGTSTLALSTTGSILLNGTVFSGGAGSATTSTLVNGTSTITLSSNGNTTFPTGLTLGAPRGVNTVNFTCAVDKEFQIETGTTSTGKLWQFGTTGNTTFPGNLQLNGGKIILNTGGNAYVESVDYGVNTTTSAVNIFGGPYQKIKLRAGFGTEAYWTFGTDGTLTLPAGGTITEGGGLTGAIKLTPAGGANAYQALLIYPTAGGDGDHLHLTAAGGTTELYLGDDSRYVKLVNGGNIEIRATTTSSSASAAWSFGTDGAISTTDPLIINVPNGVPTGVGAIASTTGSWEQNPASNLATTGGSGTGLRVSVTHTGGYASAIAITVAGTGYLDGELITVTSGGSSASFIIAVTGTINWRFGIDSTLRFPDTTVQTTAWTGTVAYSNITGAPAAFNTATLVANAVTATTVSGAAQPNITSVGTLTSLTVNGEIVAQKLTIELTTVTTTLIKTDDIIQTTNNTASTGTTTGALVVAGGVGIGGNLYVGGSISLPNGAVLRDTDGDSVAFGNGAGATSQGVQAVAIGLYAGSTSQGGQGVAIGFGAGSTGQGENSVAVGYSAGETDQGTNAIAIGYFAGQTNQSTGTIIINASSSATNGVSGQQNSLYIRPIRSATTTSGVLQYNPTTYEVTYSTTITATASVATVNSTAASVGYMGLPQNATSSTTLTISDAGKHIYITTSSQTITIPANSSVPYPIGTTITFIAGPSATTVTIAITSDTMRLAGAGTTGSRTLAAHGMATAVKVASTDWYINGTGLT